MMLRFVLLYFWASLVWATPFQIKVNKVHPLRSTGRIVNGDQASLGQFPWQAAMSFRGDFNWFCGGSIISEEWIVTAGHCVDGARYAYISTGLINLNGNEGASSESDEFYLHEDYDGPVIANDIGLVKLKTPLTFDQNTRSVPMATEPLDAGVSITVSGWGITSDEEGGVTEILNYVSLVTISNEKCEESYEGVFDEIMCAVSDTEDIKTPCNGDSGGPVVVYDGTNPILVAVVSFVSDQGCEAGLPSGYTRIAFYQDWIANKTGI